MTPPNPYPIVKHLREHPAWPKGLEYEGKWLVDTSPSGEYQWSGTTIENATLILEASFARCLAKAACGKRFEIAHPDDITINKWMVCIGKNIWYGSTFLEALTAALTSLAKEQV